MWPINRNISDDDFTGSTVTEILEPTQERADGKDSMVGERLGPLSPTPSSSTDASGHPATEK